MIKKCYVFILDGLSFLKSFKSIMLIIDLVVSSNNEHEDQIFDKLQLPPRRAPPGSMLKSEKQTYVIQA